mgnify:CR=1 FL=1|tara:strand:+ start:10943 stop:12121 length:1179 start_codon:yes stop_codon:yes gene_type:complete
MPVQNFEIIDTNTDVTTTRTLLHEVIPMTGTIVSGTYYDNNIKNYSHGMFQSVYDYPYLSSSANHIFDITCGFDESALVTGSTPQTLSAACNTNGVQCAKKLNMYNQFSQLLLGYTGSANTTEIFESDLNISDDDNQMTSCYFITLSRLLMKEQIKKGTFSMTLGTSSNSTPNSAWNNATHETSSVYSITLIDASASAGDSGGYKSGLPGGDYGVLYVSNSKGAAGHTEGVAVGNIWYQAGIIVLTSSVFLSGSTGNPAKAIKDDPIAIFSGTYGGATYTAAQTMVTGTISGSCDIVRQRIQNISFNNTTEINSKIYFCRVPHNKYNYSSNPTYTDSSKIRVKDKASDPPISYVSTVGLYNSSNELLAVAKLSEPLRKDPTNEITLRVRLDY